MQRQSGCILPQDFTILSTVFEKVLNSRAFDRESEAGECLARHALQLFMAGTREASELEIRLKESCLPLDEAGRASRGDTSVVDLLPQLPAWARSLTDSPSEGVALTERTLEHAIDHMDEFVATSDVRGWLVRLMVELRLGRRPRWR